MHPELEHAMKTGLSISEVTKMFAKHYSGSIQGYIDGDLKDDKSMAQNESDVESFWDHWKPLGLHLGLPLWWHKPMPVRDPYLSIHKGLTQKVISWLCDSKKRSNVYLIAELLRLECRFRIPTRAIVLASICCNADRLGVRPYFYNVDDIITQLAARYPPYRRVLAEQLIDNPGSLSLPTRTRFKKLILEPWKALQECHPQYTTAPPVIVIYWDPDHNDEELLHSICELSSSPHSSPLLWIITVDRNVNLPIHDLLNPFAPFEYARLPVRYDDAFSDAASILHHRFSALHQKYKEMFDTNKKWPSDEQMSHLIRVVSGVCRSVEAIADFVDRADGRGPEAHLETFLGYMVNSPSPSDELLYCALDHFYIHAFSNIPCHLLPIAKQALSIIYYGTYRLPVSPLQIACLLSVGKATVLDVHVYLSGWAITGTKECYTASDLFSRFLRDPKRSEEVWHNLESGPIVLEAFLHFLGYSSNLLKFYKSMVALIPVNPNAYIELEGLRRTVSNAFYASHTASRQAFLEHVLRFRFDFRCLAHTCGTIIAQDFMSFLHELHKLDKINSPSIVRVEPAYLLDRQFIDKCEGLAEPWDFEKEKLPSSPKYVLLGFEGETVLILLEDAGRTSAELDGLRMGIYTSAMINYM